MKDKTYYNQILNDPSALANLDIIGTHFYGTQEKDMAYPLLTQKAGNKPLWMTEVYVPDSNIDADKWPESLEVATNINGAMINGFQSYVWWYIRRSYSPIKENGLQREHSRITTISSRITTRQITTAMQHYQMAGIISRT